VTLANHNPHTACPFPVAQDAEQLLVRLEGRRVLGVDGEVLAELARDDCWYTPEGMPCEGLAIPAVRAAAHVPPAVRTAARRAADEAWIAGAVRAIGHLSETRAQITSDDVWAALAMPPRESRMIGNALSRANSLGLIEPTGEHRPSRRAENHSRPVRVWRSVRYRQQHIC
jgi:hypothetical protein